MATKIVDFIADLSVNPSMSTSFMINPDNTCLDAGLSNKEMLILKSGDARQIHNYIGESLGDDYLIYPLCGTQQGQSISNKRFS